MFKFDYLYSNYYEIPTSELENIIKKLTKKISNFPIENLSHLFSTARKIYGESKRVSGESFVNHPLRVAVILLSEFICDYDLVSAAIMHDAVEDRGYTREKCIEDFNDDIYNLISAVSNIKQEDYASRNKQEVEDEVYAALINKCREYPMAFFIKFADRVDNLCTCHFMLPGKIENKINQTKKFILPCAEKLINTHEFSNYIKEALLFSEECLKSAQALYPALNKEERYKITSDQLKKDGTIPCALKKVINKYEAVYDLQGKEKLVNKLKDLYLKSSDATKFVSIITDPPYIYQIMENLKERNIDLEDFKQDTISASIYMIHDNTQTSNGRQSENSALKSFLTKVKTLVQDKKVLVLRICNDKNDNFIKIVLMDVYMNTFDVYLFSSGSYSNYKYGDISKSGNISSLDDISIDELNKDQMTVYTKDNEAKQIIKGATVLDFAFLLHPDLAYRISNAFVNKTERGCSWVLQHGDQVEIVKNEAAYTIKSEWIRYAQTNKAKTEILEFFVNQEKNKNKKNK